ncbi:unnamed protein product [Enterobius vermicularis]|uniref:Nucleolar protein 16 n=1 Tax=Enterobius vermicularis TaxID=51028 RepID=A0A0N4V4Z1_ENTVE|nr:unnamed protein product [Enterobius vermicularis]
MNHTSYGNEKSVIQNTFIRVIRAVALEGYTGGIGESSTDHLSRKSKEIAELWNKDKTVKQNLEDIGLVYDVNRALKFLPESSKSGETEEMDVEEIAAIDSIKGQKSSQDKLNVLRFPMRQKDIDVYVYLIKRYGEDYEAMSRDPKNIKQNTPLQLQKKLRVFRRSPEFPKYFSIS